MDRQDGFRELDRQECLRLLSLVPIGRIVYTHDALPAVLPVNFSLDRDHSVVLRTSAVSRMAHAVDGAVVAFEADWFDEAAHTGWSVIVTGRATVVTDPTEQERLRAVGLRSWMAMTEEAFIRIPSELVSGRMLRGHWHGGDERGTPPLAGVV
ncbi:pyridoxamine 5'-phosphate oxidase family protein [Streptomyces halobius]|uniref:Pyridoxamine 5'-phosphate oxidase family protein n=1 Tax=Streptomyces halobius TaxID=2879846 RepID=A0ABY4ML47_9ACTN|nr:pyridoxamine 5'-phosphate oxidase family protein [Streptomyces halobius]UQA97051.1 pyridoxamine 5'-phosphate oxidase family protein [Streptomyces halobius]